MAVRALRVRFKDSICLGVKRTIFNEVGLPQENDSIQALPNELWMKIADMADIKSVLRWGAVNSRAKSLFTGEDFWRRRFLR